MRDKGSGTAPTRASQATGEQNKRKRQTRAKTAEERTARQREKQPASSSAQPFVSTNIPWPLPKHFVFSVPDSIAALSPRQLLLAAKRRPFTSEWDEYDSVFYNGLLSVKYEPTQLVNPAFCRKIEWFDAVVELCNVLGLGTMPFKHYALYPDLVREFLASCRVHYGDPNEPREGVGGLYFKLDGQRYYASFHDICRMFGFNVNGTVSAIPENDAACQGLWREITGLAKYVPGEAKHTQVKHPILRYFLRLVSTTLLCKMEPGKMRKNELVLLHYTIGGKFEYSATMDMRHQLNFGAVFAHVLESLKERGLSGSDKTEFVGSLLTPFFEHARIDLSGRVRDDKPGFLDEKNLKKGNFIKGNWNHFYHGYVDNDGVLQLISLPSPLCRIDSAEALRFRPLLGDRIRVGFTQVPGARQLPSRLHTGSSSRPSSSAPPLSPCPFPLPPFEEPPAGSYEDDPFRCWLVRNARLAWKHWRAVCCARPDDAIPPQPPTTTTTHETAAEDEEEIADDTEDEGQDMDVEIDTSGTHSF